jgi:hypothetical protein
MFGAPKGASYIYYYEKVVRCFSVVDELCLNSIALSGW